MTAWHLITNLGDSALLLPLALLLAIWLAWSRNLDLAAVWLLLIGGIGLLVTSSKIAFIGWGIGSRTLDFTGISGHTTFSLAILPSALYLLLWQTRASIRRLGWLTGLLAGVLVGISRVVLHHHSVSEALAGMVCGITVSLSFALLVRHRTLHLHRPRLIAGCIVILAWASYGERAPTQQWVTQIALALSGRDSPFTRQEWHRSAAHDAAMLTTRPTSGIDVHYDTATYPPIHQIARHSNRLG